MELVNISLREVLPAGQMLDWACGLDLSWPAEFVRAMTCSCGEDIAFAVVDHRLVTLRKPENQILHVPSIVSSVNQNLLYSQRPLQSLLPFSYQKLPQRLRWWVASMLMKLNRSRRQSKNAFPRWPLDLSFDALADLVYIIDSKEIGNSGQARGYIATTHDIDSLESLRNLPRFLEIEEAFNIKSTNFVVPCGWNLDHAILKEVMSLGHEIGLHGYNHSNQTPFLVPKQISERLDMTRDFLRQYSVRGYRSPSLLRTPRLMEVLTKYVHYDASIPNVEGLHSSRMGGCAAARPFRLSCELLEIPLVLPSDASLMFQGFNPDEILDLWKDLTILVLRSGGIVTFLTHCEKRYSGNTAMLTIYRSFLEFLSNIRPEGSRTLSQIASEYV